MCGGNNVRKLGKFGLRCKGGVAGNKERERRGRGAEVKRATEEGNCHSPPKGTAGK